MSVVIQRHWLVGHEDNWGTGSGRRWQTKPVVGSGDCPYDDDNFPKITAVQFSARIAQSVEHLICNQRVGGSNPSAGSNESKSYKNHRVWHRVWPVTLAQSWHNRSDRHFLSSPSLVGDHRRSTAGRNAAARLSGSARPEEPSDGAPPIQRDDGVLKNCRNGALPAGTYPPLRLITLCVNKVRCQLWRRGARDGFVLRNF